MSENCRRLRRIDLYCQLQAAKERKSNREFCNINKNIEPWYAEGLENLHLLYIEWRYMKNE